MERLNIDELFLIALELDDESLLALCTTSKFFNEKICKKDKIWLAKLKKYDTIGFPNLTPRELYNLLKSLTVIKKHFNMMESLFQIYNKSFIEYKGGIEEIPKEIKVLKNLKGLKLQYNKIKEIPKEIEKLKELQKLNLSVNKIKEIPKEIEKLKELQKLNLSVNKIKSIPKTLPKLTDLNLSSNKIKSISDTLPYSLKYINLNHNKIKSITETLPYSLRYLYLTNNPIKEIPEKYKNIVFI